jgi:opacity protein-like surface antigen
MRFKTILLACALVAAAIPASAQDDEPDKPVQFTAGAGFTWPLSKVKDALGDGYNINFGVQFNVNPVFGIEGLYSFNGLGSKQISIPVSATPLATSVPTDFFADMNMQYGTASAIFKKPTGKIRPYAVTGLGVYYRPVKVTTPSVGFVPGYCNPWWYYCVPGEFVPTEDIVGSRSSTDFGMVFGGGVNFRASEAATIFFELRYHYIWGPKIDLSAVGGTESESANGQFLPLTFGVRF